jgi:hypothetical protein
MEELRWILGGLLFLGMFVGWIRAKMNWMDLEFQKIIVDAQWKFIEKVLEENEGLEQENITLRRRVNEMEEELGFLHGVGNSMGRN